MQDVSWSMGVVGGGGLLAIATGLILWFIVRRQKQRLWLPVLRVIQLDLTVLPKFRWVHPPLWPLMCFFIAATALAVYLFEPSEPVIKGDQLDLRPTHVLFDLSPSLALNATSAQYGRQAQELLESLRDKAKLSYSLSSSPDIFSANDLKDVSTQIQGQGFHRAGLKLGAAIDVLLQNSPDIEHLVVASDRDQASWEDFNWRYLEKKVQISWFSIGQELNQADNVFIDELKPRDQSGLQKNMAWTVMIRRTGQGKPLKGQLKIELEGRSLGTHEWQFDAEGKSLELDILLPREIFLLERDDEKMLALHWELSASGPGDLLLDNVFRSWLYVKSEKALLIARPRGEMFLDESVFHLKTSLDVLGFRTQRIDQIDRSFPSALQPALVLSEAAPEATLSSFCPNEWLSKRAGQKGLRDSQVWLLPSGDLQDYGELCHCFAQLVKAPEVLAERPSYCEKIEHRDQYVGVLQSLGAMQIGGQVDSPLGAVGMNFRNQAVKLHILAFTQPLNPMRKGGVSFGQLPLMLQAIWKFMSGEAKAPIYGVGSTWPRIEDIAAHYAQGDGSLSNVPLAESLLRLMPAEQLPPQLRAGAQGLVRDSSMATRESDARPWIYLCLLLITLALWLEGLGFSLARWWKHQAWVSRWFGIGLLALLGQAWPEAQAQVRMNSVGYPSLPPLTSLRRDIAGRTSIEFLEKAIEHRSFERELLLEPWIWSYNPQVLDGLDRQNWGDLLAWLQRGGFLVVENHAGAALFKSRVLQQIPQGSWKPIPPDHELMRSFHLLASLPQCGDLVWEGFHFDQRIAIVLVPGDFLRLLLDERNSPACFAKFSREQALRVFINLLMVALATDYKKDQIHLPEILKRLR